MYKFIPLQGNSFCKCVIFIIHLDYWFYLLNGLRYNIAVIPPMCAFCLPLQTELGTSYSAAQDTHVIYVLGKIGA